MDTLKLVCCGCANAVDHAKDMMASKETIDSVAELFKLCGDSTRASILCALCHHELCVTDLAAVVEMSSSAVSHQLRPLKQNGIVIGYIMFGQISDLPCRDALNQNISSVCKEYGLNETEFLRVSKTIKLKSYESIMATAKIFEACISYIILNEMFLPEHDKIILESESFIDNHLENVSVTELYKHLNISRTALYEIFKKKTGLGVTEFIRKKQFEKANQLLKETDLPINDIANLCGFNDYNYFSRVFKKRYGISPKNIRKL